MNAKRLLVFLIPIFIAAMIYSYLQMPHQERVSAENSLSASAQNNQQKQGVAVNRNQGYPRLRSDLLERKSQPYPGVNRDLFFSGIDTEEIATEPTEAPQEMIVPPIVPIAPPPPSSQEVVNQDLSPYKFVGFFKKGEMKTIFLSSADEIFLVHKGDYIGLDRKYYVLDITDTTLELRKVGTGDFFIDLTDQGTLSANPASPAVQAVTPEIFEGETPEVGTQPDQPELMPVFEDELQTEDQLQPKEDNDETQN